MHWLRRVMYQKQNSERFPSLFFKALVFLAAQYSHTVSELQEGVVCLPGTEIRAMNVQIFTFNHSPAPCDLLSRPLYSKASTFLLFACLLTFFTDETVPSDPMRTGAVHPFTVTWSLKNPHVMYQILSPPPQRVGGVYWLRVDFGGLSLFFFLLAVCMHTF